MRNLCRIDKHNWKDKHKWKPSYAQIAKWNASKIVIKPKNSKNNEETKKALKRVIQPVEGLITTVRDINKNGLIVECKNSEAVEQVQEKVKNKRADEYAIEKCIELKRLKVLKLVSEARIFECVKKQNDISVNKEVSIIKFYVTETKEKRYTML